MRGVTVDEAVRDDHHLRHPLGLRRAAPGLRRHRRPGRPGVHRGGPAARAGDTEKTIAEAKALWWRVDRPNLFIKIPATKEGLPAITAAPGRGHQRQRHADLLAGALRRGHRRLHGRPGAGRGRRARPRTWRRWPRSSSAGWTPRWTSGWTRSARPRRWRCAARPRSPTPGWPTSCTSSGRPPTGGPALAAAGARPQRPLWASTSTKDPAYSDTMYVTELVAPDTVNTMPEATLRAVADHGELRGDTIHGTYDAGPAVLRAARGGRRQLRRRGAQCSRTRAWTSSRPPGTSCWRRSGPRWTRRPAVTASPSVTGGPR